MSAVHLPALTTDTSLAQYMEEVNAFPYLSQEEELAFAKRLHEESDVEAAHKLVTSHLRLVVKLAMGFRGYGLPVMDLIAEGNIGLMHAVKKFDHSKGFRLSTYAMWWIKASIQEYVLRSWSLVKIGTTSAQKKLFFNLRKLRNRLQKVDSAALSQDEVAMIAHELDVQESDVAMMDQRLNQHDVSVHTPIHGEDENLELIDALAGDDASQETLLLEHQEQDYHKSLLQKAMASLNEREQIIIQERKLKEPVATLDELSQRFGISRERVRQVEARAFEKLQAFIAASAA